MTEITSSDCAPVEPPQVLTMERTLEFETIYVEHSRQIFYLALRLLGDAALAEDVAHDVFVKAFRNFAGFCGNSERRTWLYQITLNHCSNLRKSWSARHIHIAVEDAVFDQQASPDPTPLRNLELKELGERTQKALDGMPAEYRLLLLLVGDQDLSYESIGILTQQTADAVRGKLHRARRAFSIAFAKSA